MYSKFLLIYKTRLDKREIDLINVSKFFLSLFLSFVLKYEKDTVLKALTHYLFKNYSKCDSLSTTVKVFISFVHSFIHSLRYSMSVNYLKILLDKFMVLIISMFPGIIQQCLIILSTDRQQTSGTCKYVGCHKKTYRVL